ncbi:hypothetical protein ACA910_009269 [Epithemia clementina (nom. ined.)]
MEDFQTEDDDNVEIEKPSRRRSSVYHHQVNPVPQQQSNILASLWNYLLALSALLDFAASWTHQIEVDRWEKVFTSPRGKVPVPVPLSKFWATLAANYCLFGLIFSCLWFIDAFVTARDNWINTIRDLDRRMVLSKEHVRTTSWFGLEKPTVVYIKSILFQVMLLPVGFYYLVYQVSLTLYRKEDTGGYFQWKDHEDLYEQVEQYHMIHSHKPKKGEEEEYVFEDYVSYALFFAIIRLGMVHVGRIIRKEGQRHAKDVAVHLARTALRHPISFSRRLKRILAYIRWLKYLMPIIATSNKLFQNFLDLLKKLRQKREAYIARKIRQALMKQRTPEEMRVYAALCMQKVYRANRARRLMKALLLFKGNRETIAAMKVQKHLRAALQRARDRISRKRLELAALQRKQKEMKAKAQTLGERDRARMYELHMELQRQTDYVVNKMLLRPNTPFIVWWKAAFVFAVIFEIGGKVMEPRMQKHYKSYNNMVEQHICPKRWSNLAVCNPKPPPPKFHERVLEGLTRWVGGNHTSTTSTTIPNAQRAYKAAQAAKSNLPWYCSPTPMRIQGAAVSTMEFIIRKFDIFMAVVFFLDVFISFFTGEFHEDTGVLQPPGFFARYILPGVLLQCIVNPQMETTAKVIKWCITEFLFLGPVRVTRWTVALIVPMLIVLHRSFQYLRTNIAERQGALVKLA